MRIPNFQGSCGQRGDNISATALWVLSTRGALCLSGTKFQPDMTFVFPQSDAVNTSLPHKPSEAPGHNCRLLAPYWCRSVLQLAPTFWKKRYGQFSSPSSNLPQFFPNSVYAFPSTQWCCQLEAIGSIRGSLTSAASGSPNWAWCKTKAPGPSN